jgi:penicillin-binding protein 1A
MGEMSAQRPKKKKTPSASPKKRASPRRSKKKKKKRSGWVVLARLLVVGLFLVSAGVLAVTATLSYYARDLPTVESLRNYSPPQTTRVVDRNGRLIAESFEERRTVVPMSRVPRVLVLSVLAAEDADFYRHQGLDYAGIARALFRDLTSGRPVQGASTVTQQIVKNILLTPERTIKRKIRELILARRLEQKLDKDDILFLYLNHINFGHGRYGVQEAARFYFGKDVEEINLAQASMLAGIPKAPTHFSPLKHPQAARRRQHYVLDQLEAKREVYWDDLAREEIRAAREAPLGLIKRKEPPDRAPEAVTFARRILRERVGAARAARGGYTVKTTIDTSLQKGIREALRKGLMRIDERQKLRGPLSVPKKKSKRPKPVERLRVGRTYDAVVTGSDDEKGVVKLDIGGHPAVADLAEGARFNPDALKASRFAPRGARLRASVQRLPEGGGPAEARLELGPQGAVIVIDPRSRDILALVGGDQAIYGFDRATMAVRQPGSAFKPIVYALALGSRRFTPASLVLDAPEVYDKWKPDNYETWHYQGAVRLREALAKSINLVAVRVTGELGPKAVVDFARELGIATPLDPSLALGLGASGVRPVELTNAYATFAAGGRFAPYRIVSSIIDAAGRSVPRPRPARPRQAMEPAAAYLTTHMLMSVVSDGTGRPARQLRRPVAGKTGTSNRARDCWFVGYTPEIVAGVWVGFDDHRPLGRGESGTRSALPIWMEVVRLAEDERPVVDFPVPVGIVTARIDPESGLLAYEEMENAIDEVFLDGTAPTEVAAPPDVLDPSSFLIEQLGGRAGEDGESDEEKEVTGGEKEDTDDDDGD